jgi:hypothetical protein
LNVSFHLEETIFRRGQKIHARQEIAGERLAMSVAKPFAWLKSERLGSDGHRVL